MRNKFAETFYDLGSRDKSICIVVADISPAGSISKFREQFPERFINTGVSEQIMIGMAAGMAQRGFKPFAYTIATFALYRPFEFVRDDLCYQNLPVTVVGIGGGVTYSTLGATHHAQEDVAIATALPNMNVLTPSDPLEVEAATIWCAENNKGPSYLRLGKAGEVNFTAGAIENWEFAKVRKISQGHDVAILVYGPIIKRAFEVNQELNKNGISTALYTVPTIKPFDETRVVAILMHYKKVVVIEEHSPFGGVSSLVKGLAFSIKNDVKILSFTLKDEFIHCFGSHDDILDAHGLSAQNIYRAILQ